MSLQGYLNWRNFPVVIKSLIVDYLVPDFELRYQDQVALSCPQCGDTTVPVGTLVTGYTNPGWLEDDGCCFFEMQILLEFVPANKVGVGYALCGLSCEKVVNFKRLLSYKGRPNILRSWKVDWYQVDILRVRGVLKTTELKPVPMSIEK